MMYLRGTTSPVRISLDAANTRAGVSRFSLPSWHDVNTGSTL